MSPEGLRTRQNLYCFLQIPHRLIVCNPQGLKWCHQQAAGDIAVFGTDRAPVLFLLTFFPFLGMPQLIMGFHLTLPSASFSATSTYSTSSFCASRNVLFGFPLMPGRSSIILPMYPLPLFSMCLNHFTIAPLILDILFLH